MGKVVESYEEDVVVTTRKRVVRVVEDVHAAIEAWHGGRRVAELGGWTSVAAAIREAGVHASRFGVDVKSSMSILVREDVSRTKVAGDRVDVDHRGERIGRPTVVAQRYVHDAVFGERMAFFRPVRFEWTMPILFRQAVDWPGEDLPSYFRATMIRGWRPEFLVKGYGYRDMRIEKAFSRPATAGEIPQDRSMGAPSSTGSRCWIVQMEGVVDVAAPVGRGMKDLLADLEAEELEVEVDIDFEREERRINRDRWAIWTGSPAAKMAWKGP